jgi:GNAT superfamily N-acetyltransferase
MQIKTLGEQDFAKWKPLWRGYLTYYEASLPEETIRLTFSRLIDSAEPMGGFMARDEQGVALGIVHWIDHRSCWTPCNNCYLQDLFVDGGRRNAGVGSALIEAVRVAAQARGCSRVYWITHETNAVAQSLYNKLAERSGFIQFVQKLA